jgi:hypothetical protein
MPSSAAWSRANSAWSGGKWQQKGGKWTQASGSKADGNQWSQSWWWPKTQRKESGWIEYGAWSWPQSQSHPPSAGQPAAQQEYGSKADAAAAVALLNQQIRELAAHPCCDPLRESLITQREAAEKKAVDKRTSTQKLLHAERWLTREQKRMATERAKLAELAKWVEEHQERIDKEIGLIAGLRAEVGSEKEIMEDDDEISSAQSELARLEEKELALRRKRTGPDLTETERAAIDHQADLLLAQASQKRRKMEHDQEAASAYA